MGNRDIMVIGGAPGAAATLRAGPGAPACDARVPGAGGGRPDETRIDGGDLVRRAERLAERHAPAWLVADASHRVLHVSVRAGRYIDPAGGAVAADLLRLVHPDLRPDLRSALARAAEEGRTVEANGLGMAAGGRRVAVDLVVEPVREGPAAAVFLVLFREGGARPDQAGPSLRPEAGLAHREQQPGRADGDLRNILQSTQLATLCLDNDLRVTSVTPAAAEVFRLLEADIGRPIADLEARIGCGALQDDARRVLRTLVPAERELAQADGGRHFIARILPCRGDDNLIAGVVLIFVDITARREAELRLRRSEERLAADLAGMRRLHDLHARLAREPDLPAALAAILAVAVDFAGTDRGVVLLAGDDGAGRLELVAHRGHGADSAFIARLRHEGGHAVCDAVRRTGQRALVEDIAAAPDLRGTRDRAVALAEGIHAAMSTPMTTRGGQLLGVLGVQFRAPHRPAEPQMRLIDLLAWAAADFVERHRTVAALRDAQERLRALVEGMPQLVWRAAAGGRWTWAGPQWCDYTGLSAEASLGEGWLEAVHPADRAAARAAWREAEADGLLHLDCRFLHPASGRYHWFQTRAMPVRGAGGAVLEWVGTSTDIDDQMRAREELARSAEELEARISQRTAELMAAEETLRQSQKMEAIGQLTGGIAHDFNNMLQGVSGGIEMARRRIAEGRGPDALRYLEAVGEAADRAAGLTRRLLAFARKQPLAPQRLDVDGLVRGLADLIARTVGPSIAVELVLQDGAGAVMCDRNELESALLNLCINARDAMPEGGRLVIGSRDLELVPADLVGHEGAAPGPFVELRVQDTGTGMSAEVLERVLEPFFTTKPAGEGTGLGLSQVYGLVRQSGGTLAIESGPGRGTTVRLCLPRDRSVPAGAVAGAGGAAGVPARAAPGTTLLLVDDEEVVRGPAAARLRDLGYVVVEAADGDSALGRIEGGLWPHLLVTDVGLPGARDGVRLAEEARARRPDMAVLFMTGYAPAGLPPWARVVPKPFALDAFTARIAEVLAGRADGGAGPARGRPRSA